MLILGFISSKRTIYYFHILVIKFFPDCQAYLYLVGTTLTEQFQQFLHDYFKALPNSLGLTFCHSLFVLTIAIFIQSLLDNPSTVDMLPLFVIQSQITQKQARTNWLVIMCKASDQYHLNSIETVTTFKIDKWTNSLLHNHRDQQGVSTLK